MRKAVAAIVFAVIVLGALALSSPVPTAQAKECVVCPQIAIECGPCANLMPQTCQRCAYCKHIPGCRP